MRAVSWEKVDVASDDRTLRFEYFGGAEGCTEIAGSEVDYGADEIVVTLFEGPVPDAGDCPAIAQRRETEVTLDEPVEGREIVDGSAGGG